MEKVNHVLLFIYIILAFVQIVNSSFLHNGMILGVKSVFGKCEGLNIASMAKTDNYDVMRDGQIVHPWDGVPQANLATADEYDRQFYVTKKLSGKDEALIKMEAEIFELNK